MGRYFAGLATEMGRVSALTEFDFEALCKLLSTPIVLPLTRAAFHKLPKKEQSAAKRVRYITPCTFTSETRQTGHAKRCNLLALDIDDAAQATRLLAQGWDGLGDIGYIAWHTASSTPDAPRLRLLVHCEDIALSRYPSAVRTVASMIGLDEVNAESCVPVQPMFFPTVFQGETDSPIIASNIEGFAFSAQDIAVQAEEDPSPDPTTSVDEQVKDGLEFIVAPVEHLTLDEAADVLTYLDPDMKMQGWIEVGAALKHQFGDAAQTMWEEWSAKGEKFTGDATYRWESLHEKTTNRLPITMRSILARARTNGWRSEPFESRVASEVTNWIRDEARSTEELLDGAIKRIAKVGNTVGMVHRKILIDTLKEVTRKRGIPLTLPEIRRMVYQLEAEANRTSGRLPWTQGIVFVTALNKFYRPASGRAFKPEVIDLIHTAPEVGDEKPPRARDYLVKVVGVPLVENLLYAPSQGRKSIFGIGGTNYCNTYRACHPQGDRDRAEEAGAVFMEHMTNLIKEEEYRRTLIDYLAYLVQFPGRKIRWAILLQGAQGCGKTFIAVVTSAILGDRNVKKLSASNVLDGQQNDWAYGSQVVFMEEVRVVGANRHAVMDKLKPCISDDQISLRCMYEPPRTVTNITNYVMFTNYHDSLAINDEDRRYFVLSSPIQRKEQIDALGGAAYFDRIFAMVRDNAAGLRAWFEQWEISKDFQPEGRAPVTPYLQELASNAASPLAHCALTLLSEEAHPLIRKDIVSLTALRESLSAEKIPEFTDQALSAVLRENGWVRYGRSMLEGERHQLWYKGSPDHILRKASERLSTL